MENWENSFPELVKTKWAGKRVYYYESIDSTNRKAWELGEIGSAPHGSLVLADSQTAGIGRRGRQWDSPAGENLYFSLLMYPGIPTDRASMITLIMASAVAEAVEQTGACGEKRPGIKWPNDILLGERKVAGILTQMQAAAGQIRYVVVGVGINVSSREFPGELADKATSLENELNKPISRKILLATVVERFERYYEQFCAEGSLCGLRSAYERRLINVGRMVRVLDPAGEFTGTALGISDAGELLVRTEDGKVYQIYAGEVSVRGIYGYV